MPYNYGPYYGPPQAPWVPPAGAPPGYLQQSPGEGPLAKRFSALGTWGLVLGILELVYCFYRVMSAALTGSVFALQRSMLGAAPSAPPASLTGVMASAQDFVARIALWEAIRAVPFAIASGFMISIAVRIRRGDTSALLAARTWVWFALGVIVLSVVFQLVVILPETMDYERKLMSALPTFPTGPTGAASPFDLGGFMDTATLISTGIGLILGTLFFSAWPVVLRLWADRLLREMAPPGA